VRLSGIKGGGFALSSTTNDQNNKANNYTVGEFVAW